MSNWDAPEATSLRLQGLGFAYPGRTLFQGLNLAFQGGDMVTLLGPNGVGKTTLLRCCAKLLVPTEGSVQCNATIGYVPQVSELNTPYSVLQVVTMGRAAHTGLFGGLAAKDHAAIAQAIACCDLEPIIQRSFTALSGGERQRVLVARALAQSADVLVLDEPMAAMDLHYQVQLLELLSRLTTQMKKLVIFSTHQPQHALSKATHTVLMPPDQEVECGATQDIVTAESLERCFGVPTRLLQIPHKESTRPYVVALI
jgi:iron complex transport system ATP-binding protein